MFMNVVSVIVIRGTIQTHNALLPTTLAPKQLKPRPQVESWGKGHSEQLGRGVRISITPKQQQSCA